MSIYNETKSHDNSVAGAEESEERRDKENDDGPSTTNERAPVVPLSFSLAPSRHLRRRWLTFARLPTISLTIFSVNFRHDDTNRSRPSYHDLARARALSLILAHDDDDDDGDSMPGHRGVGPVVIDPGNCKYNSR